MRGLGLTLMSGALAGTALTLVLVPVVYFHVRTGRRAPGDAAASSVTAGARGGEFVT
jgi:hypothetical protein